MNEDNDERMDKTIPANHLPINADHDVETDECPEEDEGDIFDSDARSDAEFLMGSDTEDIIGNEAESWEECLELARNNH